MRGYRKAVFVVVYSKNKNQIEYIILKRKHHWKGWEFPKGGMKSSESKTDAVKREVKEETGLRLLKIRKFNFNGKYKYQREFSDRPGVIGQTFSLYAAEVKKGRVKIDKKEHSGFRWLSFEKAVKTLTWSNQKKSLKIVNNRVLGK